MGDSSGISDAKWGCLTPPPPPRWRVDRLMEVDASDGGVEVGEIYTPDLNTGAVSNKQTG